MLVARASAADTLVTAVVIPPPDHTTNVEFAWDDTGLADGYILRLGNRTGCYSVKIDEGYTDDVVVAWDDRQPLFSVASAYLDLPETNCFSYTNATTNCTRCVTNAVTEGALSAELFYMSPHCQPFVMLTNGVPNYYIYGDPASNYLVGISSDLTNWFLWQNFTGSGATNFPLPQANQVFVRWSSQSALNGGVLTPSQSALLK